MENNKISIVNAIGDVYGVEAEDGQKIFELIKKSFKDDKKVTLSFQNVKMLTTAFLNTAIGQLYKDFTEDYIRGHLEAVDISDSGKLSLKRVVDTAKLYYKDPDTLRKSVEKILED